jgi:hypothetical protein
MKKRYAVVEVSNFATLSTVQDYLPSNYKARQDGDKIFIFGTDNAGWTLDGYVIPRLASGVMFARELK